MASIQVNIFRRLSTINLRSLIKINLIKDIGKRPKKIHFSLLPKLHNKKSPAQRVGDEYSSRDPRLRGDDKTQDYCTRLLSH